MSPILKGAATFFLMALISTLLFKTVLVALPWQPITIAISLLTGVFCSAKGWMDLRSGIGFVAFIGSILIGSVFGNFLTALII